jgi:hypothetical protein
MAEPTPRQPAEEEYFGPCPQMRTLLSQVADGTLHGLLRRYADAHLARCAHCQSALRGLHRLRERLRSLANAPAAPEASLTLSPERRAAVESAWERMDEGGPPGAER